MSYYKYVVCVGLMILPASVALAIDEKQVNLKAMEDKGFGEVSEIYQQMTPEQKAEVLKQAEALKKDLEKMTPAEREAYTNQMLQVTESVDFDKVDVKKLDPSKGKGLKEIEQDTNTYMNQKK